jgi:hypothetical protein
VDLALDVTILEDPTNVCVLLEQWETHIMMDAMPQLSAVVTKTAQRLQNAHSQMEYQNAKVHFSFWRQMFWYLDIAKGRDTTVLNIKQPKILRSQEMCILN